MLHRIPNLFFCFIFLVSSGLPEALFCREKILKYKSTIEVEMDGTLDITEEITVFSEGRNIKRGIFRDFPTKYKDKSGNHFKVGFQVKEVLRDGSPDPYIVQKRSNGKRIRIGDKSIFLRSGKHTYTLKYQTTRQIGFFKDFDELYFNVIGHGWNFSIDKVEANIVLPENAEIIQYNAYTGPRGSQGKNYAITSQGSNSIQFVNIRPFSSRTGMTITVAWPKGIVIEPSQIEKTSYFLKDIVLSLFYLQV